MNLTDKNLILGVSGGIAAYKSVELLRLLKKQGARVRVVMTANAAWFVGPGTFQALSENPVYRDLFGSGDSDAAIRHIDWAQEADAVIVAPATANIIGKLAHGIADDALSTFMLAVTAPRLICPSMNTHMYQSAAVQRNLETLRGDGFGVLDPACGQLACGTTGPGRLPEPQTILDRFIRFLTPKDLAGLHVLVTAGPTWEAIDPVRFISNPSSGKMGFAVARAAEHRGARVTLISGPTTLAEPLNVALQPVRSAREMAERVLTLMADADVIVKTAAVSDYRPVETAPQKIKKHQETMSLTLTRNPDILKAVGERKGGRILVGFAAETEGLEANAAQKLRAKNLDIIAGNLIGAPHSGFQADTNQVTLFFRDGAKEALPAMTKEAVAHTLLDRVATLLRGRTGRPAN
ncbi:MAG: bifunctional phosphopantothenoylcysteine decarboxylase/phosphopantothenate--cysteine ligase CoaBC [Desulfobacteraceae bacterium]|jgi:phosphopantothenoylcysteine decarboxylase/phosphopantothenate--cysteine ligase|nr:bifunctional phosphopantothenoylcysteine decarboxylase/phosphopantothenate--cysteine ligase CoaBC [Desulfobacteraceae bacterium]